MTAHVGHAPAATCRAPSPVTAQRNTCSSDRLPETRTCCHQRSATSCHQKRASRTNCHTHGTIASDPSREPAPAVRHLHGAISSDQRSTLRGILGGFTPLGSPPPLRSWSPFFFCIFCSFEFSRDRYCHGTRKCPHRLSSDKLFTRRCTEPVDESVYTRGGS